METDSILYIVITLAILVISGVSGRRKKKAQMMEAEANANSRQGEDSDTEEYYEDQEVEPAPANIFETLKSTGSALAQSSNPFEKLEQILSAQRPIITSSEGESMEGESLETTIDEEEQILEDIRKRREAEPSRRPEAEPEMDFHSPKEEDKEGLTGLFGNVDEIKKAIIYSEILNRKY